MRSACILLTLAFGLATVACAASDDGAEDEGATHDEIRVAKTFIAKGTGYYPANNAMEGGFVDRKGAKLRTLQQFIDGKADYVAVAMDTKAFPYGQRLRIQELNTKYKKEIVFRVVDTGGAFKGKGTSRIDICTASAKASTDPAVNGQLHIEAIDEKSGPPEIKPDQAAPPSKSDSDTAPAPATTTKPKPPSISSTPSTPSAPVGEPPDDDSAGGGQACSSDGACNPGNDGSGLICVSGQCVPGCHSNAQCPGVTTCRSGKCQ